MRGWCAAGIRPDRTGPRRTVRPEQAAAPVRRRRFDRKPRLRPTGRGGGHAPRRNPTDHPKHRPRPQGHARLRRRADRRHAPRRVRRHPGGSRPPAVSRESESRMGGCAARPRTADRRGLRRSEHECRHAGSCGPLAERATFRSAGRGSERQRIQKRGRIMQSQRLQHPRIPDLGQPRPLPVAQI